MSKSKKYDAISGLEGNSYVFEFINDDDAELKLIGIWKDNKILNPDLGEWMKAKELRDSTGLPTFLAVKYTDKDVYCNLTNNTAHYIKWGARTKQTRDWQDVQPACHIVIEEFKTL